MSTLFHLDDHLNEPKSLVSGVSHTTAKMPLDLRTWSWLCDPYLGTARRSSTRNARLSGEKTLGISWHEVEVVSVKSMDIILHKSGEIWQDVLAVCQFRCAF